MIGLLLRKFFMKKRSLLFFMICSLFQLNYAGQDPEVKKKYPHVVVKSITNYTPYNLVLADKNNDWHVILKSGYVFDTTSVIQAIHLMEDNGSSQKIIDLIQFIAVEISKNNELLSDTLLYFTIELLDQKSVQSQDADAVKDYEGLLLGLIVNNPENEQCCVAQTFDDSGSGVIEINVGLYVEKSPEILDRFKFVGNFEILNQ